MPPQPPRPAPVDAPPPEGERWRSLAALLALLLARARESERAAVERHSAERDAQRAAFQRDLAHDRESFLDLVAHELKTPVAVIRAYAEILEAQLDGPS